MSMSGLSTTSKKTATWKSNVRWRFWLKRDLSFRILIRKDIMRRKKSHQASYPWQRPQQQPLWAPLPMPYRLLRQESLVCSLSFISLLLSIFVFFGGVLYPLPRVHALLPYLYNVMCPLSPTNGRFVLLLFPAFVVCLINLFPGALSSYSSDQLHCLMYKYL